MSTDLFSRGELSRNDMEPPESPAPQGSKSFDEHGVARFLDFRNDDGTIQQVSKDDNRK